MDNAALIASGFPSSKSTYMFGLPNSSDTGTSSIYLLSKDSCLAYSLEFNVSCIPKFVGMQTFVFPSQPLEVATLASYHCVLLEDGDIYRIPETHVFKAETAISASQKVSTVTADGNAQTELAWPKAIPVPESCRLFQNKNCRSVCTLRDMACMLFYDRFQWSMHIYKLDASTSNKHDLRLMGSVNLPRKSKKSLKPCMVAFAIGDGNEENEIDSQLCQYIFGSELSLHCEGVVLVSFYDGDVVFIPVAPGILHNIRAFPLFCFHEPVIKIHKVSVKTDNSRNTEGIIFVGISGKVIILTKSKTKLQNQGPCITEFHVPGPVDLWSGCGSLGFHTDGSSALWKTTFENEDIQDEDSNIIAHSSNECIQAYGICLLNTQGQSPFILMYAESGNLIFAKNCEKSSLLLPAYLSTLKHMDLKELLTSIHESSAQLSKLYQNQEEKKKVVSELSCAAHLILNDKVRNKYAVAVIPEWTSYESNQIIVNVHLENESDFSIIGNHWHFVITVTTASGCSLSKSIPLNGFETGSKIDGQIKVKVGDIVTNNDLPFAVAVGLQLFLDFDEDNVENVHHESTCYQPPVSFFVKLTETSFDELSFFSTSIDAQLAHCNPSISDALWELARSRQATVFHDLENIPRISNTPLETPIFNFVTVKKSVVEKLLKKQGVPEGSILTSFLAYIVSDCKIVLPNEVSEVELSVFGHKIKLDIREDGINIQIKIIVWCHALLPKLRFSILQKLQLSNYLFSDTTVSKENRIKGFVLNPTVLKSCLTLNSRLLQLPSLQLEIRSSLVSHIYAEMRQLVSSELPFV